MAMGARLNFKSAKAIQQSLVVLLILCVPALAVQRRGGGGGGGASHASAPATRGGSAGGGARGGSMGASRGAAMGGNRGSMGGNRSASAGGTRSGTTGANRGSMGGSHTATTGGNRGSSTAGNRSASTGGTHAGNTGSHGATGSTHAGNTGGAHGSTGATHAGNASHGSSGSAHASNGSHGTSTHGASTHGASTHNVSLKGGGSATMRSNGSIKSVNKNGMHISRGANGSRRVEGNHGGAHVVNTGRHGGYVQRGMGMHGGRAFVSRTFVYNHVAFVGVYHSFGWGGFCCYFGYYPGVFWAPAFYGWVWNPWPAPVYWGWGWGVAPWYGFYAGYFAPYPVYPAAAFWLTDYLIAANLQAAYAAQADAAAAAGGSAQNDLSSGDTLVASLGGGAAVGKEQVSLSPEVKQAITEEVKAEVAAEQAQAGAAKSDTQQASNGGDEMPAALDPARRIFVVASDLTVEADGQECSLTPGDVVTRITDTPDADRKVSVSVSGTKKKDCTLGKTVAVSVDDLQEMHNQFLQKIDEGMKQLAKKQGTGGLPKAPDTKSVASDVPPPAADKDAAKLLDDQAAEADKTEAQVKQETSASSSGGQQ